MLTAQRMSPREIPSAGSSAPPPGATVPWKYRAIYLDGDTVFGQWSDVGTIAVTG